MAFGIVTKLYINYHYFIPEHFHHPKKKPVTISRHAPSTQPLAPGPHSSTLCLWISLFWTLHINGIIQYGTFVPGFFHSASCFQGSSCCSMHQCFVPLCDWIISHWMDVPLVVYPFISDAHLDYFHLLATMTSASMYTFLFEHQFLVLLSVNPEVELLGRMIILYLLYRYLCRYCLLDQGSSILSVTFFHF